MLPAGTVIEGKALGGLTLGEARLRVERDVAGPLMEPIDVTAGDHQVELDPSGLLAVDTQAMLEQAMLPKASAPLHVRVATRVTGEPTGTEVPLLLRTDERTIREWVDELASEVDTPSVDSTLTVVGAEVRISEAEPGRELRREQAVRTVSQALLAGWKRVAVPVETIEPAVDEDDFGATIVVDRSARRLHLYEGDEPLKTYRVAVGAPGYSTPQGWWTIVAKRYLPTWYNPGSAWAKDMPAYIGPGPGNPLGTRALNLDAPGIRIHGTSANRSIGTAASHGCIRMHMWDVEDLYRRVEVGTRVVIVP